MRRQFVRFVVLAAAIAAFLVPSSSALNAPQKFSLLDISEVFQPIGGFDFSRLPVAGDRFALTDGLYKWAGAKRGPRVGHLEATCMFSRILVATQSNFSAVTLCTGQVYLAGGQIVVEGFVRFGNGPANFRIPVIGGTGTYANARGWIHIRDLGGGDSGHSNVDFYLLP